MSVKPGEDFKLRVETVTPGTFVDVADMNAYSKSRTHPRNRYRVFGGTVHVVTGSAEEDFSVGGYLNPEDPGQARLLAVEASETPVNIQVLYDGTKGYQQQVLVHSFTHDADPEGLQEDGFEFTATGVRTSIAAGVLL